jgi:DNA-binding response OmpR family regulator
MTLQIERLRTHCHRLRLYQLTADPTQKSREKALASGCDEFELKPIDFAGLAAKIQSLVSRSAKP